MSPTQAHTHTHALTFKFSAVVGLSAAGNVSNFQVTLAPADFAFELKVYKT